MKIIAVDNYGRNYIPDELVSEGVDKIEGESKVKGMNTDMARPFDKWYRLVEDDYKLYDGMDGLLPWAGWPTAMICPMEGDISEDGKRVWHDGRWVYGELKMTDINELVEKRKATHGDFGEMAHVTQTLKQVMHDAPNWETAPAFVKEGCEMIVHKIARALSGDWDFRDHYDDIAGYAQRVAEKCSK